MAGDGDSARGEITGLLVAWREGESRAYHRLFPLVYDELRRVARRQLGRGRRRATLDTTSLVHESYLKLVDQTRVEIQDRNRFFALSATVMRHILVDYARRRTALKRGGEERPARSGEDRVSVDGGTEAVVGVHEALRKLEALDERLARLVELRYFGGLSVEEAAEVLEISPRTVKRDWQKARAFLYRELAAGGAGR